MNDFEKSISYAKHFPSYVENSSLQVESAPLSTMQQETLFVCKWAGDTPVHNEVISIRINTPIDQEALQAALDSLAERHATLRTGFSLQNESTVQEIVPSVTVPLKFVDLRSMDSQQRQKEAVRLATDEACRPFQLSQPPLVRALLMQLSASGFRLDLTLHHLISDSWSLQRILAPELHALYELYHSGRQAKLKVLRKQYADFALKQQVSQWGLATEESLRYWQAKLDGMPMLEMPTDRPRPSTRSFLGGTKTFLLPQELSTKLNELSRRNGTTTYLTLLAAFAVLLSRYSRQEDIAIGSAEAGRRPSDFDSLIGCFLNFVVMRIDLSGNPTFREVLARVRSLATEAYGNTEISRLALVDALGVPRDSPRPPLFQVAVIDDTVGQIPEADWELSSTQIDTGTSKFELSLKLSQLPGGQAGKFEYDSDLFDASTIARLGNQFHNLLESIVEDPDCPVSELPLLTPSERQQLTSDVNATTREYPRDQCVHVLFEEQAARTPDQIAVVFGEQQLTYRELNRRSNQLAHHLRNLGVGPDRLVGICLERSVEMLVGILGILKAGGAYVPLDPSYPARRMKMLLDDIRASFVVTRESFLACLGEGAWQSVCLDRNGDLLDRCSVENLDCESTSENLAYVLYTSGSTGKPKGVPVCHRSIVRLVCGADYATFGSDRIFLQLAPVSFDASTFEIWGALLHGARLVVAPAGTPDLKSLEALLQEQKVTTLWLTASLFNSIVDNRLQALAGVEEILTGGEALSVKHVREAQAGLPTNVQLINGYGPTEGTTFTCCHRIDPNLPAGTTTIPLGRPISNTQVYVVDRHDQLCPIGVAGELLIGGDGLARGYLNDARLTAAKFIPNPFCTEQGSRVYRSGDIVRWRADGTLEFLGRRDHQVKLRGYRIELGEVEGALAEHPAIAGCKAMIREDQADDRRLTAYWVARRGCSTTTAELRAHLSKLLPDCMVPSTFVEIESLPLNANGKIDCRQLPAPVFSGIDVTTPRNQLETDLAEIWADLLGIKEIGIHDDFFLLGGHSLLAVRLLALVEKQLDHRVSISKLIQAPTVADMAAAIQEANALGLPSSIVTMRTGGSRAPLFFLPGIAGEASVNRHVLARLGPEQPVYGLRQSLRGEQKGDTIESMAKVLCEDVCTVCPTGPVSLAGYSFSGMLAYEVAQQLAMRGREVQFLAMIDSGPGQRGSPSLSQRLIDLGMLFRNIPRFLVDDILQTSRRELWKRTLRKVHSLTRRFAMKLGLTSRSQQKVLSEDLFDVDEWPEELRAQVDSNLRAFYDYRYRPYPGKVTLFRARTSPLLHSYIHDLGWSDLVGDRFDIRWISGNHISILSEPNVQELAFEFEQALCRSQKNDEALDD